MATESFQGVDVGSDTTVFFRFTEDGSEGFVVDNVRLVETLKRRVLEEQGLAEIVEVTPLNSRLLELNSRTHATEAATMPFEHQFAPPFSSLHANLRLAPLDAPETEALLMPLTIAIALTIVIGLWVLYRAVAARLEFAVRQNNFVSAVTHELKTPLTAIRLHGEMLQDGLVESPEKAQEYYRTITSQAERLSRLIGNVLSLSNIERRPDEASRPSDVGPMIRQAANTLLPHIRESGFSLVLELPDHLPPVFCDADAVEQILFNLVDNALKYARSAEDKRITIAAELTARHCELSVRDRGPGVSESQLTKIFEPFFRGEDELTRSNTGTGLGLSLVSSLAERMKATSFARRARPGLIVGVCFLRPQAGTHA